MDTSLLVYLIGVVLTVIMGICFAKFVCFDKYHMDISVGDITVFVLTLFFSYIGFVVWLSAFLAEYSDRVVIRHKPKKSKEDEIASEENATDCCCGFMEKF